MLLSVPVPPRACPWQAGAGTSPSPCLQALLFLQDALNPVSHPDSCFNISAVSGGGRRQHSPGSFPQVSHSYRSSRVWARLCSGLGRADGGFSLCTSVRSPPAWICPDLLVGKTGTASGWGPKALLGQLGSRAVPDTPSVALCPCGHRAWGAAPPGSVSGTTKHQQPGLV